jgi:hypothetical protein
MVYNGSTKSPDNNSHHNAALAFVCLKTELSVHTDDKPTFSRPSSVLRRSSSASEKLSASKKASAVSKNHMCFLIKCTTIVPPTRLFSYRVIRPSRLRHARSAPVDIPIASHTQCVLVIKERLVPYLLSAWTYRSLQLVLQRYE